METPISNDRNNEAVKPAKNDNYFENIRLERREYIKTFLLSIRKNNSTPEYDDSLNKDKIVKVKIRILKDSLNKMIYSTPHF